MTQTGLQIAFIVACVTLLIGMVLGQHYAHRTAPPPTDCYADTATHITCNTPNGPITLHVDNR